MEAQPILVEDEYMHEPTDHPQFNESAYYNLVDNDSGFGVLIRMGNRVNEGYAEVTVLIYLPDGGAAIRFDRAPITNNDAFDAGGLKFTVIEPLQVMEVTFEGTAYRLKKGTDLADPKTAFTTSTVVPLKVILHYDNLIPVYGLGDGSGIEGAEDAIATGHYQGPCRVSGTVELDGEVKELSGLGFRDHSWGPRIWQGPRFWRWLSCLADDKNGFTAWVQKIGDETSPGHGSVLLDGVAEKITKVEVSSSYSEEKPHYPVAMTTTLHTETGREVTATGEVFHNVPLRHRREGVTARLAEVLVRFQFEGHTGYGVCEYHDLMHDGVPAGMTEA
jgi:hypothetical protein